MSQTRCEASGPPETLNLFWMTPILFSPDNLARSQRACLNLLKSLTSVPQPIATAHTDTAVPPATMRKPFKHTAACAAAAAQRHRQAVICYLSACLPRLDELVPARGAGVPATPAPVSSRGLPFSTSSSSVCSGGDLLVRTLWDLAVTPEEASVIQQQQTTRASESRLHAGSAAAQPGQRQRMRRTGAGGGGGSRLATATTSATGPAGSTNRTNATAAEHRSILPTDLHTALTIRPFLLAKAKFLHHLDPLLKRTLLQMAILEGKSVGQPSQSQLLTDDCLTAVTPWNECLPSHLSRGSGTGALDGSNPGYTLLLLADLLRLLQPMKELGHAYQNQLVRYLLHICLQLRPLVFQLTASTTKAEKLYKAMLDQLAGVTGPRIREFLWAALDFLAQYPDDDLASAAFLLDRMCAPVCPISTDLPPFPVSLSVWGNQEDYLFVRRIREVVSSDTRGFGPRIHDVINYICTENNLTTDMRLEIVCENQILMPELRLQDVYTQIWLANPSNANSMMELIYRIPGLEEDNLPYVEQLTTPPVPVEQYSHLAILAEHPFGLKGILSRLATVRDALKGRELLVVSMHILEYCLKIPECQKRLLDPELNAISILLGVLLTCLRVMRLPPEHADLHEKVTGRLVRVLTNLLQLASSDPQAVASAASAASGLVSRLLASIAEQPDLPVVRTGVARLPGLLAFGDEAAMAAIVDFMRPHVHSLLSPPDSRQSVTAAATAAAIMDCCCALVVAVPNETPSGRRLRSRLVTDLGLLKSCVDFLWNSIPEAVLDQSEESALDTKEPTMAVFLNEAALPPVLKLMRGCVWSCQPGDPTPPPFPSAPQSRNTRQLLAFLHKLETSKSVGQVGLLAEDLLDEWVGTVATAAATQTPATPAPEGSETRPLSVASVIQEIKDLRQQTVQRNRRLAKEVRQRQLRSLNMKVNEKGQLAMLAPSHLAKMTAEVVEETGLLCAICHEGPRAAPKEPLGIYVFVRRCPLEEGLPRPDIGKPAPTLPSSAYCPEGYTTVSSFVLVHFSCHLNAVNVSNMSEWTVAARHNRDARCNCLLPVMGRIPKATPPTTPATDSATEKTVAVVTKSQKSLTDIKRTLDSTFATYMAKFSSNITSIVSLTLNTRLALQDIKLLLLRFAHGRPFHGETGGGARESNLNLLPYLMQIALYQMNRDQSAKLELDNLLSLIEKPETHWCSSSAACWDPVGPLYSIVAALHLLSPRQWREHRVRLLRHLMALAHARATMLPESSSEKSSLPPPPFSVIKPYLLFFGLVKSLYEYFFKDITLPPVTDAQASEESESWRSALCEYIRASDEELLNVTPKLLSFFESDLTPSESAAEFLDVIGMTGDVDSADLEQLAFSGKCAP
ncbi:hypothetical protein AAHC03_025708 [Spirometra sp. Aus1]